MAMPLGEYRARYNAIQELKSIKDAAASLGISYSTLGKWYHEHKDEFPPTTRESIKNNSGRTAVRSNALRVLANPTNGHTPRGMSPEESWVIKEAEAEEIEDMRQDGPAPARNLVDALFMRFSQLKADNERLFLENTHLQEENSRLRGAIAARRDIETRPTREKARMMLEDITANSRGSS